MIENAILLDLKFSRVGEYETVNTIDYSTVTTAKPTMIRTQKRKFVPLPALSELVNLDQRTRLWLTSITGQATAMARGLYFVAPTRVSSIEDDLVRIKNERLELVDRLVAEINLRKQDSQDESGDLWNEGSYPSEEAIRSATIMDWAWIYFSTPTEAQGLEQHMVKTVNERAQKLIETVQGQLKNQLRDEFLELVGHLKEKLTPDADGKPKRFKQNSITNVVEFLDNFKDRNFADDEEMDNIVSRAQELFTGVNANSLRNDEEARANFKYKLGHLVNDLDITEKSKRSIIL